MTFRLETTSTFTSNGLEEGRYVTAGEAWRAAALDYLSSDAGLPTEALEHHAEAMQAMSEAGEYEVEDGEVISVIDVSVELDEMIEGSYVPREAIVAYGSNVGYDLDNLSDWLEEVEDAYAGEWDDREDFARETANDLGVLPKDNTDTWPLYCIDWEHAARELFYDYTDAENPSGGIYVFRNI
ncbi:antirestriction protein ArdA [Kineococcus sp. NPDC059986]|uniref:antirestriction protein ArdA n=1 Tax=Actinomycetes TaxID=1760 RepID=UPI00344C2928